MTMCFDWNISSDTTYTEHHSRVKLCFSLVSSEASLSLPFKEKERQKKQKDDLRPIDVITNLLRTCHARVGQIASVTVLKRTK